MSPETRRAFEFVRHLEIETQGTGQRADLPAWVVAEIRRVQAKGTRARGGIETRYSAAPVTVRSTTGPDDGSPLPKLAGYAAVFNSPSKPIMGEGASPFLETIKPGAFVRTLRKYRGARECRFEHDPELPIAWEFDGSLTLAEDERGLFNEIDPVNCKFASELIRGVRLGITCGQSFGFSDPVDSWAVADGSLCRDLEEVTLVETSIVRRAAYPATLVWLVETPTTRAVRFRELRLQLIGDAIAEEQAESRRRRDARLRELARTL